MTNVKSVHGARRRRPNRTFRSYIHKVLKQVSPKDTGISHRGVQVIDGFMSHLFDQIARESVQLCRLGDKKTVGSREIQTAVRLVLPKDLAQYAVSEGTKAVTKFSSA